LTRRIVVQHLLATKANRIIRLSTASGLPLPAQLNRYLTAAYCPPVRLARGPLASFQATTRCLITCASAKDNRQIDSTYNDTTEPCQPLRQLHKALHALSCIQYPKGRSHKGLLSIVRNIKLPLQVPIGRLSRANDLLADLSLQC
jgi:hypothetical protein